MVVASNRIGRRAANAVRQRGVSTVEYALLVLGIIAMAGVAIVLLEGGILGMLGQVSDRVTAAASS